MKDDADNGGPISFAELYTGSDAYGAGLRERRLGGTFGLELFDADQPAVDVVDPGIDQFAIAAPRTIGPVASEIDFGDGWRSLPLTSRTVDMQPANQDCGLRIPAIDLRVVTVSRATLHRILADVGAAPDALDAVTGEFRELPRARAVVDRLWQSCAGQGAAATLETDGLFLTLVGELLDASGKGRLARVPDSARDPRLLRVIDYLETHLGEPLSVGELAAVGTMSAPAFARAFRAAFGESAWSRVQRRRVERARELLERTRRPISQVALECGFSSQSHLTRCCRQRFGATPGEIRRG